MDYNFVLDHLATGAGINAAQDVQELTAAGVTHVIDCRAEQDDAPLFTGSPQISYLWNPTADDGQPKDVPWFAKGVAFALPALCWLPPDTTPIAPPPHPRVYCHCAAGINRGPSMTFAIMLALGFRPDLAEQLIRAVRPQVGLAYKGDAIKAITALGY